MRRHLLLLGLVATAFACSESGGGNNATDMPRNGGATPIYDVQGNGAISPIVGQSVMVEGVVTGDFQNRDADSGRNLGGFFIQGAADGAAGTSDGIFVFDGNNPKTAVAVGDQVRVAGVVNEHFGETQIETRDVVIIGDGVVDATPVSLPTGTTTNSGGDLIADLERFEGMLVQFPQALTVTSLHNLERFGEVALAAGSRPYQFTNRNRADAAGYRAHREALAARSILLDDGRRAANASPVILLTAGTRPGYSIRSGDEVESLTGNIRYSRGSGGDGDEGFRLMATIDPVFTDRNPRPGPPTTDGALRVVSMNALNLFSTVDRGRDSCGPRKDDGCRGADSATELQRQLQKHVTTLDLADADVVGLVELENNGGAALQLLVDALNERSSRNYDYVDAGFTGADVITGGLIYDRTTVTTVRDPVLLDASVDERFNDDKNRPALAQAFRQLSNGAVFSVVVNHLKSKGSPCDDIGDPNARDGQGNCNRTRTRAAEALADWVLTDPTGSGDTDYLVIGDMNAYLLEDPITALTDGRLTDILHDAHGLDAYSFSFDGQIGALDHALVTPGLAAQVAGVDEWHINADEPRVLDYNLEFDRDPDLFDPDTPYRSSDHDPLVIGLDLIP